MASGQQHAPSTAACAAPAAVPTTTPIKGQHRGLQSPESLLVCACASTPDVVAVCWLKGCYWHILLPHIPHTHTAIPAAGDQLRGPIPQRLQAGSTHQHTQRKLVMLVRHELLPATCHTSLPLAGCLCICRHMHGWLTWWPHPVLLPCWPWALFSAHACADRRCPPHLAAKAVYAVHNGSMRLCIPHRCLGVF